MARSTAVQEISTHEKHIPPVAAQTEHAQAARSNPEQRAAVNHGTPQVAATPKPGAFSDHAVAHAKATGTPYTATANRAAVQPPGKRQSRIRRKVPLRRNLSLRPISLSPTSPKSTSRSRAAHPRSRTNRRRISRSRIIGPSPSRTKRLSTRKQHRRVSIRKPNERLPQRKNGLVRNHSTRNLHR